MRRLVASGFVVLVLLSCPSVSVPQTPADKSAASSANKNSAKFDPHHLAGVWDTQHPGGFKPGTYTFFGEISADDFMSRRGFQATRPSIGPRAVPDSTDPVYPTKLGVP